MEEIKEWIARLRSGTIEQCRGHLVIGDKRCCMGVFGEVCGGVVDEDKRKLIFGTYINCSGRLPVSVYEEHGLTYDQQEALIHMNDAELKTFAEIADWIEENVLCAQPQL